MLERDLVLLAAPADHIVSLAETAPPVPLRQRMRAGTAGRHAYHEGARVCGHKACAPEHDVIEVRGDCD